MNHIGLGLMEQSEYRKGTVSEQATLNNVTHVEYKYMDSVKKSAKSVEEYGGDKFSVFHVQYPREGEGSLNLVHPRFRERLDNTSLNKLINELNPSWISFHLGFAAEELQTGGQFGHDIATSKVLPKNEIRKRIIDNINYVKKKYPGVRILLENLDYNPYHRAKGAYEYVTEPGFIKEILDKTDTYMLLDLAHAEISAKNTGYKEIKNYINALPLDKVVEIHLAKPGEKDGYAHDSHKLLTDTKLFEYVLDKTPNLKAVTLETFEDVGRQLSMIKGALKRKKYPLLEDILKDITKPEYYFNDLDKFEHRAIFDNTIYAWQAVDNIGNYIEKYIKRNISPGTFPVIKGEVGSFVPLEDNVYVEKGAKIEPFVHIKGNVRIGKGTIIKSFTNIEGNVWIGNNTMISGAHIYDNNIIGDHCDIRPEAYLRGNVILGNHVEFRSEAKNSVFMDGVKSGEEHIGTAAAHYSYIGDSIIGRGANLGAGTKISNVKTDWTKVAVNILDWKYNTGRFKFGALVGDLASTGCNSVINPGSLIGKVAGIYPTAVTRGFIPGGYVLKINAKGKQELVPMKKIEGESLLDRGKLLNEILETLNN